MGEIIYPGILMKRVDPNVNETMIRNYIKDHIGKSEAMYQDGKLDIKIYKGAGKNAADRGKSRVVVSGIRLSLDEIKRKFKRTPLHNDRVFIEADFGVPRKPNGDMTFFRMSLHNHLKAGQGNLPIINLFNEKFNKQFGSLKLHTQDIFHKNARVNLNMINIPGEVVAHGGSNGKGKTEKASTYTHYQLEYMTKLESLQAVCMLGGNRMFCKSGSHFQTKLDGTLCGFDQCFGLGIDGKPIQIRATLDKYGYVPLDMFKKDIIDKKKINALCKKVCPQCKCKWNVLGYGPDMGWLAATCDCIVDWVNDAWHKEKFFRLALNNKANNSFHIYHENFDASKVADPYKLRRGQMPLYDSVHEMRICAYGAYLGEEMKTIKDYLAQMTTGRILAFEEVEKRKCSGGMMRMTAVQFDVSHTEMWSESGSRKIGRVTLTPKVNKNKAEDSGGDAVSNGLGMSDTCMEGRLLGITDEQGSRAYVYVMVQVPVDACFDDSLEYYMVPKPPTSEKRGIGCVLSSWEAFIHNRREKENVYSGTVRDTSIAKNDLQWRGKVSSLELNQSRQKNLHNVWLLRVSTLPDPVWTSLEKRLRDCYIGIDVTIRVGDETIVYYGRVVNIATDLGKAEPKENPNFMLTIVVILPDKFEVKLKDCSLELWMIRPQLIVNPLTDQKATEDEMTDKTDRTEKVGKMESRGELMVDLIDELEYPEPEMEDDKDYENKQKAALRDPSNELLKGVEVHVQDYLPEQLVYGEIEDILEQWRYRPFVDLSMMDFFLKPSKHVNHSPIIKSHITKKKIGNAMKERIESQLNDGQKMAVRQMKRSRLAVCQGPPGTGKSHTAVMGAIDLFCTEEGLTVMCAPSNYATKVLYEKLQSKKKELGLDINVVYMLAYSREENCDDPNFLHVRIRNDKEWESDEELCDIINEEKEAGIGMLSAEKKAKLHAHRDKIAKRILSQADVVVCTVGCATDFRIYSTINLLKRSGRKLLAVICDESSLLSVPSTIPLLYLNPCRIWLLGDDHQLRPVVSDSSALNACLGISWMELLRTTPYFRENQIFTMLEMQYRMAAPISRIISGYMYEWKLKSDSSVSTRKMKGLRDCEHKDLQEMDSSPMIAFTYENFKEEKRGDSYVNEMELKITLYLLECLDYHVKQSDVAIIVMYEAQAVALRKLLRNACTNRKDVEVATIDSFQGKDRPIVIVNCVRSNPTNSIGFLREQRRLNVALSRVQHYLFLVANIKTLVNSKIPDVVKLISLISKENVMVYQMQLQEGNAHYQSKLLLLDYLKHNKLQLSPFVYKK